MIQVKPGRAAKTCVIILILATITAVFFVFYKYYDLGSFYSLRGVNGISGVYYKQCTFGLSWSCNWIRISSADNKTFRVITYPDLATSLGQNADYAKDKNHVYFQNNIIEDAKPESFAFLEKYSNYGYAKDNENVFYYSVLIKEADMATFNVADNRFYDIKNLNNTCMVSDAFDKNNFYFQGNAINTSFFKSKCGYDYSFAKKCLTATNPSNCVKNLIDSMAR